MTTYTKDQLEVMEPRELDAIVAETVMGYVWKTCPGYDFPLLCRPETEIDPDDWAFFELDRNVHPDVMKFSTEWEGLGRILIRMASLGFKWSLCYGTFAVTKDRVHSACFTKSGANAQYPLNIMQAKTNPSLPRAAAIAAVLASQSLTMDGDGV